LTGHLKFHENFNIYACNICGHAAHSKTGLRVHLETHEKYSNYKFKCEKCVFAFNEIDMLARHVYNNHRLPKIGRKRIVKQ
jgi:hypothetical protein